MNYSVLRRIDGESTGLGGFGSGLGIGDVMAGADARITSGALDVPEGATIPKIQFVYESEVTLTDIVDFGQTTEGTRRIIPITGGTFKGPDMNGEIMSIGADWNLSRSDGGASVEAAYYLRTDDGVTIRVINKGVGSIANPQVENSAALFLMFTTPVFEAPTGKYDWMNRTIFVATLGARPTVKDLVLVRVFKII